MPIILQSTGKSDGMLERKRNARCFRRILSKKRRSSPWWTHDLRTYGNTKDWQETAVHVLRINCPSRKGSPRQFTNQGYCSYLKIKNYKPVGRTRATKDRLVLWAWSHCHPRQRISSFSLGKVRSEAWQPFFFYPGVIVSKDSIVVGVSVPRIQQWSLKEFPLVGIICCFGSTHSREIESDNF
jgi:hypothetical protein